MGNDMKKCYFKELNDGLALMWEDKVIFGGITAWLRPDARNEVTSMLSIGVSAEAVCFKSEDGCGSLDIRVAQYGENFAVFANASYAPELLSEKLGNHFHPEEGFGLDISYIGDMSRLLVNHLKCEFWCRSNVYTELSQAPVKIQGMLWDMKHSEGFGCVLPVCDKVFKSNFKGITTGLRLYCWSNDYRNHTNMLMFAGSFGNNPKELLSSVTGAALKIMGKKGKLRTERRYPEILEYLGWCSWDAFHMDVTHADMIHKAQEFTEKNIPVRWFIIDDMWGNVPSIDRPTMHSRELYSFEADPKRFPMGLGACIGELKENYGIKMGVWHPTTGYWYGIHPEGEIAKEQKGNLVRTLNGKLVHSPDMVKAFDYYNAQHSFYRDCGAEFVKVDNQGFIRTHYAHIASIGEAASQLHTAIEASVGVNFDGAMINCMCMPSENFWNRPTSSVCRFSGDFQPEDRKWFIQHILQCSFNSIFQGCVYYGDWDMWWSDDSQGKKNAVLRAMSGGPVYMSDEYKRSVRETIMPIVYSDGRIIRLPSPATPSPDCLMEDAEHNGKIFKVVNRIGKNAVLAAFNLDSEENTVSGDFGGTDMELDDGRYVCYDWFGRMAKAVDAKERISLTLKDYDDFRLYAFVPISENGKAVIGLKEKYMSPATVRDDGEGRYTLHEGGTLLIYSETDIPSVKVNGAASKAMKLSDRLYEVDACGDGEVIVTVC